MSDLDQVSGGSEPVWRVGGRWLVLWVERGDRDPWRPVTVLTMAGLVIGATMVVFGLPPIGLHPPFHYVGIMDPLCGMTRGSVATLRGDLARAWWYNPGSPLVIAGGVALVARWVAGRLSGVWLNARLRLTPLVVAVTGLLVVVLWVNQQLHVDRLR